MTRRKWLIERPFWFGLLVAVTSVLIGVPWGKTWDQQAMNVVLGFMSGAALSLLILLVSHVSSRLRPRQELNGNAVVDQAVEWGVPGVRRSFEPFTSCPGCKETALHLLGRRHQSSETAPTYLYVPAKATADIWWPLDDYESARTIDDGVNYRIRNGRSAPRRTFMVIDRECMGCGKKWEEKTGE